MLETPEDLAELQRLFDGSLTRSGEHLRSIIDPGRRTPTPAQVVQELTGMKVLVVATVSADGRPRTSCVDGHFLRGHWVFTTSADAVKARDLRERPAVSATYVDGERFALFTHGDAEQITEDHPDREWIEAHLVGHYGQSPTEWGPAIAYLRINPRWSVAYAFEPSALDGD